MKHEARRPSCMHYCCSTEPYLTRARNHDDVKIGKRLTCCVLFSAGPCDRRMINFRHLGRQARQEDRKAGTIREQALQIKDAASARQTSKVTSDLRL